MGWHPAVDEHILAVVVLKEMRSKVVAGGAPVFVAADAEEQNNLARALSRVLEGMAHELAPGIYVVVRH